jgi:hypothetical protein
MAEKQYEKLKSVETGETQRRPYSAPEVTFFEPLEAFAAICDPPAKANPIDCPSGPISS